MMTSLDEAERVVNNYIIPIISGFGIVCNVLNLVVLTRRRLKESPYTYLLGLALSDLSVLSLSFVYSVFSRQLGSGVYAWRVYDAYIFVPLANVGANASVWITVLLTMERFPLKAKDVCTKALARKGMATIFCLSLFINIPRFFCQSVVEVKPDYFEVRSQPFELSSFYKSVTWFYIVTIHVIPLLTLIVLNTCLLAAVWRASRQRADLLEACNSAAPSGHPLVLQAGREQWRLTITCISIICLFIVCIVPSAFSNRPVAMAIFGRGKTLVEFTNSPFYRLLKVITNTLVFCNLSLNFLLYCVFNHKFVQTLKYLAHYCFYQMFNLEPRAGADADREFHHLSSSASSAHGSRQHIMGDRESASEPCLNRLVPHSFYKKREPPAQVALFPKLQHCQSQFT